MFWRRKSSSEKVEEKKKKKFKKVDGPLWGYMVSQGVTVDVLQNLRLVERSVVIGDEKLNLTMVRIFDPAATNQDGVVIEDYGSLDEHPELILYEGHYESVTGKPDNIKIEKK